MDNSTYVILRSDLENKLVSTARARLPYETCGVLHGTEQEGVIKVNDFSLIRNSSPSPQNSFVFHPEDWISLFFAQKNQRQIVGLFHTHPLGSTAPSISDYQGTIPWKSYWIISLAQAVHELSVYRHHSQNEWHTLPIKRVL